LGFHLRLFYKDFISYLLTCLSGPKVNPLLFRFRTKTPSFYKSMKFPGPETLLSNTSLVYLLFTLSKYRLSLGLIMHFLTATAYLSLAFHSVYAAPSLTKRATYGSVVDTVDSPPSPSIAPETLYNRGSNPSFTVSGSYSQPCTGCLGGTI